MPKLQLTAVALMLALFALAPPASATGAGTVIVDPAGDAHPAACPSLACPQLSAAGSEPATDILATKVYETTTDLVVETTYLDVDKPVATMDVGGRIYESLQAQIGTQEVEFPTDIGAGLTLSATRNLTGDIVPGTAEALVSSYGRGVRIAVDVSVHAANDTLRWALPRDELSSAVRTTCPGCAEQPNTTLFGFSAMSEAISWTPDPVLGVPVPVRTVARDSASEHGIYRTTPGSPAYTMS